jgi:hypothetical protein
MTRLPTTDVPLEADEAHALMQYMQLRGLKFTHVKNETAMKDERGKIKNFRALMDWQDGVSPGFPDFIVALPGIGLLCLELKRVRGGSVSTYQAEWIRILNLIPGVEAHVIKGALAGIAIIEDLIGPIGHTTRRLIQVDPQPAVAGRAPARAGSGQRSVTAASPRRPR